MVSGGKCIFGLDDIGFWVSVKYDSDSNRFTLNWANNKNPMLKWVWNGDATKVLKLESVDYPGKCLTKYQGPGAKKPEFFIVPCTNLDISWIYKNGYLEKEDSKFLVKNK